MLNAHIGSSHTFLVTHGTGIHSQTYYYIIFYRFYCSMFNVSTTESMLIESRIIDVKVHIIVYVLFCAFNLYVISCLPDKNHSILIVAFRMYNKNQS